MPKPKVAKGLDMPAWILIRHTVSLFSFPTVTEE